MVILVACRASLVHRRMSCCRAPTQKRGEVQVAGTARRVLRRNWTGRHVRRVCHNIPLFFPVMRERIGQFPISRKRSNGIVIGM